MQQQQEEEHRQHSIFHNHSNSEVDSAAVPLPSRQSLRVISSSHAEPSHASFLGVVSHSRDASAAAVHNVSHAVSHIPRPTTAAAAISSAAKETHVPDGRFEFVGASIADGRRKQLARPATAVSFCCPHSVALLRTSCVARDIQRIARHH